MTADGDQILAEVLRGRVDPALILARMRGDYESDWPNGLMRSLAAAPLVDEATIEATHGLSRAAQFLAAASHGLTVEMTAELYGVSPETVKTTLRRARTKLGAKSTTHAVAKALRMGLIKVTGSLSEFPRQKTPLRQEIAEIVRAAGALVASHERRNPTSDYTLGEEEALMFLKERIATLDRRIARRV